MGSVKKTAGGALSGAASGMALGGPLGAGIGGIVGGLGGLLGDDSADAMDALQANKDIYGNIKMPTLKDYNPEAYNPTDATATQIKEDPALRTAQLNVLSKMAGLSNAGLSDVDNAGFERARELGNQMQNSSTAAALQNAQARGVGGSGLEFALREMGNQAGAGRAQDAGLQQAATSAQQRALYNQAYGNALSGMRGQDFGVNSANTGILNDFNKLNTQTRNQAQQYNVGQSNAAQQYNNQMAQQQFQDQMSKANGLSGANKDMAGGYAAQDAANQSALNSGFDLAGKVGVGLYGKNKTDTTPAPTPAGDSTTSAEQDQSKNRYALGDWNLNPTG